MLFPVEERTTVSLPVSSAAQNPEWMNSNRIAEGQQVSTAAPDQSCVSNGASDGEAILTGPTMQEAAINTSSDVDGVITAVALNPGIAEGVANLNTVFALTAKNGRVI